jgi:uncharacterized protein (TIGR03437 family)
MRILRSALLACLLPVCATAGRYAVFLTDEPGARASVTEVLRSHGIPVTGNAGLLLRAVFVDAATEGIAKIRSLPGVAGVSALGSRRLQLNRAATLVNAPAAWTALGGIPNAGLGIRIGIVDSGIDQTHPAFQDPTLPGIPCTAFANNSCAYTNNKVIVARSYIQQLGVGTTVTPATSRPDDFSPRDRVGHGTAVAMIAAGFTNTGPQGTITGIAPKAYLGNYKVRGSNGINEIVTDDVLIMALEDALLDGMDVVNLSVGGLPIGGPLDSSVACGNALGVPCDPLAAAAEQAVQMGTVIVCAAGDDGEAGQAFPSLGTVVSPANSPSVIAVAATSNSHAFSQGIQLNTASPLVFAAQFANGSGSTAAPVKDVASVGDPAACSTLPPNSLAGSIAIAVQSGTAGCSWPTQAQNAASAGAIGIVFTLASPAVLTTPVGFSVLPIPAVVVSMADGSKLRANISGGAVLRIDPGILIASDVTPNLVAGYSSRGPGLVAGQVKPEIAAVGTAIYTAAERLDPSGDFYNPGGYSIASGTSFACPLAAGAAALVKQSNRALSPAQIKSALVNSASSDAIDGASPAGTFSVGAGRLNIGAALGAPVSATPATIAFGPLNGKTLPISVPVQLANTGVTAMTIGLSVTPGLPVSLDQSTLTIPGMRSATVNVTLTGTMPAPGVYEGQISVTGTSQPVHIPFQYVVGDRIPYNVVPISGDRNIGTAGQPIPDGFLTVQVSDRYGVPVQGLPVTFRGPNGAVVSIPSTATNAYGVAKSPAAFGPGAGSQIFVASAGALTFQFEDFARLAPTVAPGGVVDAASSTPGNGVAPGSYITLYGSNLAESTAVATTLEIPPALAGTSVSFDVPAANISVAGRMTLASPGQINVQVPWELAGQTSTLVKVNLDRTNGKLVTVPLSAYSPNFFLSGSGLAAALDEHYALVGPGNPAQRGHTISFYTNGLGPVTNQPATGQPALASPLSTTTAVPTVTIGGVNAPVSFSGLAPGFPCLYQVNAMVPANAPVGTQPVSMSIGGVASNTAMLNIQ